MNAIILVLTLALFAPLTLAMDGESVVLAGTEPAKLLFLGVSHVRVHSSYDGGTDLVVGKGYVVDAAAGTIARTAGSAIPDYASNILYGQKDFVHDKFPGYGNGRFFVYVDYDSLNEKPL